MFCPLGVSSCYEEHRLVGQSAGCSTQTCPAQTGELRSFSTVQEQQTEGGHSPGD